MFARLLFGGFAFSDLFRVFFYFFREAFDCSANKSEMIVVFDFDVIHFSLGHFFTCKSK
jgi:hypothetical protein